MDDFLGKLLGQAQDKPDQEDVKDYLFGNYTIPYEDPTSYMGQDTVDNPMLQFGKEADFNTPSTPDVTQPVEDPRIADLQAKLQLLQKSSGKLYKAKDEPDVDLKKYLADNKDVMQRALESQNKQQFINNLAKAGSMIGSSIAGAKPQDTTLIDSLNKQSGEVVGQAENEQKQNMNIVRLLQDQKMQREAREARKEAASLAAQIRQDSKNLQIGEKEDQYYTNKALDINKQFQEQISSQRTGMGVANRKLRFAQDLKALLPTDAKQWDDLPDTILKEMTLGLTSMLSPSGIPSVRLVEGMTPKTLKIEASKMLSKLTGKPEAANAGGFIKMFNNMIDRQIDVNADQLNEAKKKFITPILQEPKLAKHPTIKALLTSEGYTDEDIKQVLGGSLSLTKAQEAIKNQSANTSKGLTTSKEDKKTSGKVRVSNGSETLEIDPEDLKHALADGYKQI